LSGAPTSQRIDKWLWFARFVKSRSGAARLVADGKVRVNRVRVVKPSHALAAGDVLTFTIRHEVQVVRVLAPGSRRGPAVEAHGLYEDLTPKAATAPGDEAAATPDNAAPREPGSGRPTKRDRRKLDEWLEPEG
jgi:ribosome-associated heat shock protein Hsp15